ncbi:hypothetical protein ACWC4A_52595 [Streptomyces mirabilis]
MTTDPAIGMESDWDQATYGTEHTATTQDAYIQAVSVHHDAHALWDGLTPIEPDGLASILSHLLPAPDRGAELLALARRHKSLKGGTGT